MLPSLCAMIDHLSKLQREFLIDHVDGLRPFADQPVENSTRRALLFRNLIRYEPSKPRRLGKPDGTMLTDDGREALGFILGDMADNLTRAIVANHLDEESEASLLRALHESAYHSQQHQSRQESIDANPMERENDPVLATEK